MGLCGDQPAAPRHTAPALQTFPPLHQRPPSTAWGGRDGICFLVIHLPFPPVPVLYVRPGTGG